MATKQTAHTLSKEVLRAEKELKRPQDVDALLIDVRPADVEVRMRLFQPRMITHAGRGVDAKHVKKLKRRIGTKGELDPITVVKLGTAWVCVDGHHRLEAYTQLKWDRTIKADWFAGTVREAVAESLSSNEVDKLEMTSKDRFEAAWQRIVLGWGSTFEIARECNVGRRTVGYMKAAREAYPGSDALGIRMRSKLGLLEDNTWGAVRMVFFGIDLGPEKDLGQKAATLAHQLTNRMTDFLSRDPEVTALALKVYDPELPQVLMRYLKQHVTVIGDDDDEEALELPMVPKASLRVMTDEQLMDSLEVNREHYAYLASKRVAMEREQDRRASLGSSSETPEAGAD